MSSLSPAPQAAAETPPIGRSVDDAPLADHAPLSLENLAVGDQWVSEERKITADDVSQFAELTGDEDPLHTDDGAGSPFGQPVAHGLLGLSVMAGLSSERPRVATLALVEISAWRFEAPIFFGDRVRVRTTVQSITPHGRRAGRVVWTRELLNQKDRVVQSGEIVSLVARACRQKSSNGLDVNLDAEPMRPKSPR